MPRKKQEAPLTFGYLPSAMKYEQLVADCPEDVQPERVVLFFKYLLNRSRVAVSAKKGRRRSRGNGVPKIESWVEVHYSYLERLFGKEFVATYKHFLVEKKYVEMQNYSHQGGVACRYRICWDRFDHSLFEQVRLFRKVPIYDKKAYNAERNLYKHRKSESLKRLLPEYQELVRNMETLKLDLASPAAQALVDKYDLRQPMHDATAYSYLDFLEAVEGKDIEYYIVDKFGQRFHTVYTTLRKTVRELLHFEDCADERLRGLDIVNSQPWLASVISADVVRKYIPECAPLIPTLEALQTCPEYDDYRALCCRGDIYQRWIEVLREQIGHYWRDAVDEEDLRKFKTKKGATMPEDRINAAYLTDRDAAKICFYRVIYGYPNAGDKLHEAFRAEWPGLWEAFKAVKSVPLADSPSDKVYANLALVMQRLESAMMFNIISKFFENGVNRFITIYDGVLVLESQWDDAKALMLEAIAEMGLPAPQIKE